VHRLQSDPAPVTSLAVGNLLYMLCEASDLITAMYDVMFDQELLL
jgi:hypothetical protein